MKICEMQSKYYQVNLQNMLEELGKDRAETILSAFSCPQNEDVEYFLKRKAILFSQQGFAKTFLVFWCSADETERYLIGYYSIASKVIEVERNSARLGVCGATPIGHRHTPEKKKQDLTCAEQPQ